MASTAKYIQIVLQAKDGLSAPMNTAANSMSKLSSSLTSIGSQMTAALTVPIVALGALAAKTAIDFEEAFAGVAKTVGGTTEELAELRKELEGLATSAVSPVSSLENAHMELFKIAEAAGQLGVAKEDIADFTDVMGQLAMTTDLAGEEGAQMIARFANIADMPLSEIRQFGDAINTLGNNSAATEKDILSMSLRLASIADLGFETDEILAYSTALSSLGINAELGGTNFTKGMNEIAKAVALGGTELSNFADVAGMTSAEFSKAWKEDAGSAFQAFINGLGEMNADERILELEKLGLTGSEMQRVFLSLAGSTELLTETLNQSSEAFAGNGALMEEASKFAETTAGRINRAKNMFNQVMNDFGELLLPLIVDFLEKGVIPLLTWINSLDDSTRQWILGLLAAVAAIGPLMSIIGGLVSFFGMLSSAIPVVTGAFTAFLALGAPVIALIGLVIGAIVLLIANWEQLGTTMQQIGTIIDKSTGQVFSKSATTLQQLAALVGHAWQEMLSKAGTTLSQLGQIIWQRLSSLGSQMMQLGQAIISGLIKGLMSKAVDLVAWATGMSEQLKNTIKSALGIASPSKVMMELGKNVVEGFHKGIESMGGIGVNVPQAGGSIQSRQPSLAVAGAGAGGSGGNGNVYIENLTVPPGTTQEQIKYIMKEIGKEAARLGAKPIR